MRECLCREVKQSIGSLGPLTQTYLASVHKAVALLVVVVRNATPSQIANNHIPVWFTVLHLATVLQFAAINTLHLPTYLFYLFLRYSSLKP
jgi:hypothetical protein